MENMFYKLPHLLIVELTFDVIMLKFILFRQIYIHLRMDLEVF